MVFLSLGRLNVVLTWIDRDIMGIYKNWGVGPADVSNL